MGFLQQRYNRGKTRETRWKKNTIDIIIVLQVQRNKYNHKQVD
jgi:ribosomal protein L22